MCPLEAPAALRREWLQQVAEHGEAFLERLPRRKVYEPPQEDPRGILQAPFGEEGAPLGELLDLVGRYVEANGINLGSAGHLGFIPPSSLYPAALGDYLATVINRYAGVYFAAPGAVQLENMVLRWMADFVGFPQAASGDLTSGGSLANMIGVVTAREAAGLRARDYERAVVYLSEQTHHSVGKALRIAGMQECVQRRIPLDAAFHMQPQALAKAIAEDRRAGRIPWLIVGAAGTTDTGAVDPLEDLGEIARREGLWLHVDGAYGAMFALCGPGQAALRGMERADSLALDPHKGLFMPCGSGAVLVRDGAALRQAHAYDADYLQDEETLAKDEISPSAHSPELTRPLRGMRIGWRSSCWEYSRSGQRWRRRCCWRATFTRGSRRRRGSRWGPRRTVDRDLPLPAAARRCRRVQPPADGGGAARRAGVFVVDGDRGRAHAAGGGVERDDA